MRVRWLVLVAVCAASLAGCGSDSTGRVSADAVKKAVTGFGGPDAKAYQSRVLVKDVESGEMRWLPMVVACEPGGGCEVVAPDGAGYPDLEEFTEDSKLLKPGDEVLGAANITSPGESVRTATYVKGSGLAWVWYTGGGAALVLLGGAVSLVVRARRRRKEGEALLRAWEEDGR
ncbi:hypothetical protein [Amycolatopsis sp. CA-230715]|uniref:hypothetical protein n=1 Tax=Amycolatopsis sp. CA-230715 TaxID=2745196 RepID=UPI001C02B395|nr:hypothetical protein [Amycolatopsis sp. CA-230715]QWF84541.1 hypothetical protein HUW46_07991 [Amycolatopsis sp. CA-230715]